MKSSAVSVCSRTRRRVKSSRRLRRGRAAGESAWGRKAVIVAPESGSQAGKRLRDDLWRDPVDDVLGGLFDPDAMRGRKCHCAQRTEIGQFFLDGCNGAHPLAVGEL